MAQQKAKGSIILEILIVILVAALLGTILYPKKIWEQTEQETKICRANMDRILKAELIYLKYYNTYEDTLDKVISFIKSDTTGTIKMEYVYADSVLAQDLLDKLTKRFPVAKEKIDNFLADTLMFTVLATSHYDSNLATQILKRYEKLPELSDSVKAYRGLDSSDVWILGQIAQKFSPLELATPLYEDDSLKLVMQRTEPEISTGTLIDSLYKNTTLANVVDSAVFATLDEIRRCPSVKQDYEIVVNDTSVIKTIDIYCPLDSAEIEASKSDFLKYHIGHLRLKNHGNIKAGEKSWAQ